MSNNIIAKVLILLTFPVKVAKKEIDVFESNSFFFGGTGV
jgi:hypothetical protein